jgi:hypothetical protein
VDDSDFLTLRPIELEPELAALSFYSGAPGALGVAGWKKLTLSDRVEFGGPLVVPVDSAYRPEDSDLQAFLKAQAKSFRFALAEMSVNFPFGDPPLATASVEVDLADDAATGQTFAYSILPTNLTSPKDATRGFTLQPNVTVLGTGGSMGGPSWSTTDHGTRAYMIGGPELSPHPAWMFQRSSAQDIEGSIRLVMVIQVPAGRTGSLTVSLQASLHKRLRFFKRQIPLPGADAANPAVVAF